MVDKYPSSNKEIVKNNAEANPKIAANIGEEALRSSCKNISKAEHLEYDRSEINLQKIQELALYVAKNTKKPFSHHNAYVEETEERIVNCGFLNLSTKKIKYPVRKLKSVVGDYWSLCVVNSRRTYKPKNISDFTEDNYERVSYCLRNNGDLFIRNESWREATDPQNPTTFLNTENNIESSERPLNIESFALFDFEQKTHWSNDNNIEIFHDGAMGELIHKSKGEGLIARLEKLLRS